MEPLDPPGVGVTRSHPEPSGVVRCHSESELSGVVRSLPGSFGVARSRLGSSGDVGVVRSRPESFEVDRNRSWLESTGAFVLVIRLFLSLCFFVFHFARALLIQAFVSKTDLGRLQTTPDDSVYGRFRMNPDDSDSERLQQQQKKQSHSICNTVLKLYSS